MMDILQKLEDNNMHVHVIDHEAGYSDFSCPLAWVVDSTHFIMKEDKIIYVGNIDAIERFILMLKEVDDNGA